MPQQDINQPRGTAFKRSLHASSIFGKKLIASSDSTMLTLTGQKDSVGLIVEEYAPPTPAVKSSELSVLNGPSKVHNSGVASYKTDLRLLFPNQKAYADFLMYCNAEFTYYDELGFIYNCSIMDSPEVKRVEGGRRFDVKISLVGTRKEEVEEEETAPFSDIAGDALENSIREMAATGLITLIDNNDNYVRTYRPGQATLRSELFTFLSRLEKFVENAVRL